MAGRRTVAMFTTPSAELGEARHVRRERRRQRAPPTRSVASTSLQYSCGGTIRRRDRDRNRRPEVEPGGQPSERPRELLLNSTYTTLMSATTCLIIIPTCSASRSARPSRSRAAASANPEREGLCSELPQLRGAPAKIEVDEHGGPAPVASGRAVGGVRLHFAEERVEGTAQLWLAYAPFAKSGDGRGAPTKLRLHCRQCAFGTSVDGAPTTWRLTDPLRTIVPAEEDASSRAGGGGDGRRRAARLRALRGAPARALVAADAGELEVGSRGRPTAARAARAAAAAATDTAANGGSPRNARPRGRPHAPPPRSARPRRRRARSRSRTCACGTSSSRRAAGSTPARGGRARGDGGERIAYTRGSVATAGESTSAARAAGRRVSTRPARAARGGCASPCRRARERARGRARERARRRRRRRRPAPARGLR